LTTLHPEYHPKFVGLTGTYEQVAKAAKAYRVYFSKPTIIEKDENYIVDHSIFMYLMDPQGRFVDCFGMNTTAQEVADACEKYILQYKEQGGHLKDEVSI
jgi:protein SCO1/2